MGVHVFDRRWSLLSARSGGSDPAQRNPMFLYFTTSIVSLIILFGRSFNLIIGPGELDECEGSIEEVRACAVFVCQTTERFVSTWPNGYHPVASFSRIQDCKWACAELDCWRPSLYWSDGGRKNWSSDPYRPMMESECSHVGEQSAHAHWHPIGHAQWKMEMTKVVCSGIISGSALVPAHWKQVCRTRHRTYGQHR